MYISESGSGSPVVLLHGAPSKTTYFAALADVLAPRARVLAPEFPGYGRTPRLAGAYSIARANALLEDALLSRGVAECAVLGYSLGGYRALLLALSGRVRVTRLYLLSGHAGLTPEHAGSMGGYLHLLRDPASDLRGMWRSYMLPPGFAESHPAEAADVTSWIDAVPRGVLADEVAAVADLRAPRT